MFMKYYLLLFCDAFYFLNPCDFCSTIIKATVLQQHFMDICAQSKTNLPQLY